LFNSRLDQSGLNGCCTAMWKANGKSTKLLLLLDSGLPKTEIYIHARCFLWRQNKPQLNYSPIWISRGSVSRGNIQQQALQQNRFQGKEEGTPQLQDLNV